VRRLEQRTQYGTGPTAIFDEWGPADEETQNDFERHVRNFGDSDDVARRFVRSWNATAKRHGDWTRIRSVEVDEE
jgi:hypothetical protein